MTNKRSDQRSRGAYYTPNPLAEFMTEWLFDGHVTTVLEPSSGDGAFLRSVMTVAARRGITTPHTTAVELSREAIARTSSELSSPQIDFVHSDFLSYTGASYAGVIGNPPFVRLRHLPPEERRRALEAAHVTLGHEMDPSGSVWMPFVLHACRLLRKGGRLAMVLPLDATYVRYAKPFWRFLGESFAGLRVVRVRERLFPTLLQDVVLLFADGATGSTPSVRFEAFADLASLVNGRSDVRCNVDIIEIVRGDRAFLSALLNPKLQRLLNGAIASRLLPAGQLARFRIGYVAGDKTFFHPTRDVARQYELKRSHLVATIAVSGHPGIASPM